MIKDLEELDEMELNPVAPSPYNDKVIREKRRKLLESLIRTVDFYCKEDPSRGREFKMMIEEYKDKRLQKESFSESVKNAQTVDIEAIPLPEMPFEAPDLSDIPLPGSMPQSILKKPPGPPAGLPPASSQLAPGHPPGLPPSKKVFISRDSPEFAKLVAAELYGEAKEDSRKKEEEERGGDMTDDDDEEEFHHRDDDIADDFGSDEDDEEMMSRRRGVHFADDDEDDDDEDGDDGKPSDVTPLQAMMLKLAGQKIPKKPAATDEEPSTSSSKRRHLEPPGPPPGLPPGPPPGMPPMMKTGMLPPGPPPGLPPGPPPGMPGSSLSVKQVQDQLSKSNSNSNPNVFSAPPSLIPRTSEPAPMMAADEGGSSSKSSGATISAKPQLTTVPRGEATRFMPTSLRVRREVKQQPRTGSMMNRLHHADDLARQQLQQDKKAHEKPSADAAYDTFMKEMKGLL